MSQLETKELLSEIAKRHGFRLDSDDPRSRLLASINWYLKNVPRNCTIASAQQLGTSTALARRRRHGL